MSDKIKAVFLGVNDKGRAKLAEKVAKRTNEAKGDIAAARQSAGRLPDEHPDKASLLGEATTLEGRIDAAQPPVQSVGDAYCALGDLRDDAADLRKRAEARVAQDFGNDPKGRCALIEMNIAATKRAALRIGNEAKAKEVQAPLAEHERDLDALATYRLHQNASPQVMGQFDSLLKRAVATRTTAEKAIGEPPEPGSEREKSRTRLAECTAIPGLDGVLDPTRRDARGRRNAAEESAARLNVFDAHFAQPETDAVAKRTNKAMRTAAIIKSMAGQQARTKNDPALEGKIGNLMVAEYGADMDLSPKGRKLTQALVIDDPVEKLLTGKIRFEDAVGRVRDQAAIGSVKPSKMLDLLIQQVELKLGSMDRRTDIQQAQLPNDPGQGFVLSDREGELSTAQAKGILGDDGPKFGAAGLMFAPDAIEQLKALREEVVKWDARERKSKSKPQKPFINTQGERPEEPLITPEILQAQAAKLTNPSERTEITGYEYDEETGERVTDSEGRLSTRTKKVEALPYVPAPGLGQDHQMDGPLDNSDDPDALYGALDDKQYAHLRMLQRADEEEDRQKVFTYTYTSAQGETNGRGTPEQIVYDHFKRTYKLDDSKTDALLKRVVEAFKSVPLTVTFAANSLFGADKDAPAHGTTYVSDVQYTRGKTDTKSLIGRDDNTKVDSTKLFALTSALEAKQKELDEFNKRYAERVEEAETTDH